MKQSNIPSFASILIMLLFATATSPVAAYTTVYNGVTYASAQLYNLNVYYFRASDVTPTPNHRRRISGLMLWVQNWYGQQMQTNGYGYKTFGLYTEQANPDSIRLVQIDGAHPLAYYRTAAGNDSLLAEVARFAARNPTLESSDHRLVLIATPSFNQMQGLPYYGIGRDCYATDYPQLDLAYLGTSSQWGQRFVTYFGGMAHELGHGLNLPHSHQTTTENANPAQGTNLMADGNYTFTSTPTFLNRAGAAILAQCQVFAPAPGVAYYNGHSAGLTRLRSQVVGGVLYLSGSFATNRAVTDVNFYQDPFATPSAGYARVAFSAAPIRADSFAVAMPAVEVLQGATYPRTGPYNLEIELVLANGETATTTLFYNYQNGLPVTTFDFGTEPCVAPPSSFALAELGRPVLPGTACYDAVTGSLTVQTWGSGFDDPTADRATFVYAPLSTVDTVTARVLAVDGSWNSQAGLMVRGSLDSTAAFAMISALDTRGVFWSWRAGAGGSSLYQLVRAQPLPMWLRLTRDNNVIVSWYSTNGTTWTRYYQQTLSNLPPVALAGLLTSKSGNRAVFDHISIGGRPLGLTPPAAETGPLRVWPMPPAGGNVQVSFKAPANTTRVALRLTDLQGREVWHQTVACPTTGGETTVSVPLAGRAAGVYVLQAADWRARVVVP